jgi:hypothetical protein
MAIHSWRMTYRAAVLEPNKALLEERITAAQRAMMQRLTELAGALEDRSEIRSIEKGLRNLVVIKWERLGRTA